MQSKLSTIKRNFQFSIFPPAIGFAKGEWRAGNFQSIFNDKIFNCLKKKIIFAFLIVVFSFSFLIFNFNEVLAVSGSWVPGKFGSAYNFRGSDTIDIGNDVYSDVRTVSFWVKLDDTTESILELRGDTYVSTSAGILSATGFTSPTIYVDGIQTTTITAGAWRFVAVTTGTAINATAMSLGTVGAASLNGALDDVRFYNYAQTQKQILQDMNAGHPSIGSPIGSYIGYWDFNEGYGATAFDKSNNSKDLTLSSASWTLNGKFGKAFDAGDNKRVADDADDNDLDFEAAENFTLSAWFNRSAISNAEYIIYKENGNEGYALYLDGSGDVIFGIGDTNSASFPEESIGNLGRDYDDSVWHHAVAVKTGVSRIDLYVDGILIASDTSLIVDATLENAGILYIGDANATDGTDEFLGDIDEVKIYPFALTPAEVKQEYNRGGAMVLGSERNSSSTWDDGGFGGAAPVAWWKMDEKTGQYVYDSSGSENSGTLGTDSSSNGSDPAWKPAGSCKRGACLSFDGTNDYVNQTVADFRSADTFGTIEGWVKLDALGLSQAIVGSGDVATGNYFLWLFINVSNYLTISQFNNDTADTIRGSTLLTTNKWYHVAGVSNATSYALYVNGNLENLTITSGANTGDWFADTPNRDNITISALKRTGAAYFLNGLIDDIRIYNYARTPAQIAWDYNRGKPKLYWKFDENTGTTAYDYYKTKNGTITGPDWTGAADQCKFNYCLDFVPANSDYVDVGDTGIGSNLYSVSFWIYPDSVASQNIIDFDGGTRKITTDASGNLTANGWSSPTYYKNGVLTASPVLTASTWQHIMITTATAFNPNDVDLGRVVASYFDGKLDEIKFYTYPLTADQVKQDYNEGAAVRFGPSSGLP